MFRLNTASGAQGLRRKIGVVGIAAVSGLALAACGSSGNSTGASAGESFSGQTLTVYTGVATGRNAEEIKAFQSYLSAAFRKETGASLDWEGYTSPSQETSKLETSIVSGSGPDVFGVGPSYVTAAAASGDFVTLTAADWKMLGGKSSFTTKPLEQAGTAGIAIPYATTPAVLVYNKAEFAKAGITTPPATWTQYIEDAKKVMAANPGVYGAGFDPSDSIDPWKFIWSYTQQLGGTFISANGKSASIDSTDVNKAVEFYFAQDYKYHIVPPQSLTWNGSQLFSAFTEGTVAMDPIAFYSAKIEAAGTKVSGNIGFAPLPNVPYGMSSRPAGGTAAETIVGGTDWIIPKYAGSETQLAMEFAKLTVSPAAQLKVFQLMGQLPVTDTGIKEAESTGGSDVKAFITAGEEATLLPPTTSWSYVENGMETVLNHIATQLATTHSYSADYVAAQLSTEESEVTASIASSGQS
jgi:multiple sugar transport system substrate-binding protein